MNGDPTCHAICYTFKINNKYLHQVLRQQLNNNICTNNNILIKLQEYIYKCNYNYYRSWYKYGQNINLLKIRFDKEIWNRWIQTAHKHHSIHRKWPWQDFRVLSLELYQDVQTDTPS